MPSVAFVHLVNFIVIIGKIIIKALPAIETKGLTDSEINDLMQRTSDIMQKAYHQLYRNVSTTLPKTHPFFVQ